MALFVLLAFQVPYGSRFGNKMPNPTVTPGATVAMTTAQVCATRWGKDERHVTLGMKRHVCALYGQLDCPGKKYELDHLISRELAGADVDANLWPQPIKQARMKDRLENWLHKQVCKGKMPLADAQSTIRKDWWAEYQVMLESEKEHTK